MTHQLEKKIFQRLEDKGIGRQAAPEFIRNLTNILSEYPLLSLSEVNRILQYLGWQDVDLDAFTFQLLTADLKHHQISGLQLNKPSMMH